jgi:S-adenosylmethionine:tRNA ribosyltransferase-isomerase
VLVSDFHFDLPEELIAQHPPAERGASRMLVLKRATGTLADRQFAELPQILQPGDLLILNDSRVLPARLFATRAGARTQANSPDPTGLIEVLLTEQLESAVGENVWNALVKPARKVHPGETLHFQAIPSTPPTNTVVLSEGASAPKSKDLPPIPPTIGVKNLFPTEVSALTAEVLASGPFGQRTLRFAPTPDFYNTLTRIGHMPLPPYIRRAQAAAPDSPEDLTRYQTVYSHQPGSAAAPTAGLHFTPEILSALIARGVEVQYLTLHVGLGTFQPVRVSELKDIRLHSERYTLPAATAGALNRALRENRRIVAVGTTTTRTLEHIAQIDRIEPHSGSTSIFLAPGHRFRIVSGLLTNFHLPSSTLLMLVSAFADATKAGAPCLDSETLRQAHGRLWEGSRLNPRDGRETILRAYAHAIRERYRFYSYGDCMLLL